MRFSEYAKIKVLENTNPREPPRRAMNTDSAPHNLPAESRPSLLGGGAQLVDRVNILEAVDAKPKKGPSLSPLLSVVLLGAGLSAALGAVHWLRSSDLASSPLASTRPAEIQSATVAAAPAAANVPAAADAPRAEAAPSVAQVPAAAASPAAASPVAASPVASAAPVAAVVSAPAPVVAAPVTTKPAPPVRVAAAPAPQAAAPAAKPEPARAKAPTAVAAAAPRDAAQATQSALRSLAAPPQVVAVVATRPSTAPGPSSEARPSQQKPDVELINAIMRHVSQSTDNGVTISGLVKQCMNSDDIESLMCRRRVCDGNWGNSSACPMGMAPRAARSAALVAQ